MAIAEWAAPGTQSSNIAGTTLNSLGTGSTSAFVTYDNSTARDLYAAVTVVIGAQGAARTTGANIVLRVFTTANAGGDVPTDTGAVGGGETYTAMLNTGTTAQTVVFPMVRLYPFSLRLQVTNNSTQTLGSSGNQIKVQPYGEDIT